MGKISTFILTLLIFITPAIAQINRVTSGEHENFSRLVFPLRGVTGWELVGSGASRQIVFSGSNPRFDFESVFSRIPRTRLDSISMQNSTVFLSLACSCHISEWVDSRGFFIVDIIDDDFVEDSMILAQRAPDILMSPHRAGETLAESFLALAADAGVFDTDGGNIQHGQTQIVLESIARASTQGLLEAALLSQHSIAAATLPSDLSESPTVVLLQQEWDSVEPSTLESDSSMNGCEGSEFLNEISHSAAYNLHGAMAVTANQSSVSFDLDVDVDLFRILVGYLSRGFGAEARTLIVSNDMNFTGREFALGLADHIEGRQTNSLLRISSSPGCSAIIDIISAIYGRLESRENLDHASIASAFLSIPVHLQSSLGVDLVESVMLYGDRSTARIISEAIHSSPWSTIEDAIELSLLVEEPQGSDFLPASALHPYSIFSPELIDLISGVLASGSSSANYDWLSNAQSTAWSVRAMHVGGSIMANIIRERVRNRNIDGAFEALDILHSWERSRSGLNAQTRVLKEFVWLGAASSLSSEELLETVFRRSDWLDGSLSEVARGAIDARLSSVGMN